MRTAPLKPSREADVNRAALPRRGFLKVMGASFVAAVLAGCGIGGPGASSNQTRTPLPTGPTHAPSTALARSSGSPIPLDDTPVCVLTPQATEGPFYFDPKQIRQDIVEDRVGAPLRIAVRVMRVDEGCTPLQDALVDLWHADAGGLYSGYPRQLGGRDTTGQTFLRGMQVTNADGVALFDTIYPGWYPGRTVHIHFKSPLQKQYVPDLAVLLPGRFYRPGLQPGALP